MIIYLNWKLMSDKSIMKSLYSEFYHNPDQKPFYIESDDDHIIAEADQYDLEAQELASEVKNFLLNTHPNYIKANIH